MEVSSFKNLLLFLRVNQEKKIKHQYIAILIKQLKEIRQEEKKSDSRKCHAQ